MAVCPTREVLPSQQGDGVYHGVALATRSWYSVGAHLAGVLILYFDKHIAHVCH